MVPESQAVLQGSVVSLPEINARHIRAPLSEDNTTYVAQVTTGPALSYLQRLSELLTHHGLRFFAGFALQRHCFH